MNARQSSGAPTAQGHRPDRDRTRPLDARSRTGFARAARFALLAASAARVVAERHVLVVEQRLAACQQSAGEHGEASWNPATGDDKVFSFLKLAMAVWHVDPRRVHTTGFSRGGMETFRFICSHADVLASAAPAAGTGCPFSGAQHPSRELPILYMHGTKDALVSYDRAGVPQKDAAVAAWKMTGPTVVQSDAQHRWERCQNTAGTVFELISHDYDSGNPILGGHCCPGSKDLKGGAPGQLFGFACKPPNASIWEQMAMQFFLAHPKP
jgi:hypothetical protein